MSRTNRSGKNASSAPKVILVIFRGMGPEAITNLYQFIITRTAATRDQEHIPTLIYSLPKVPDRTAAIMPGDTSILPCLTKGETCLEKSGASCTAIPPRLLLENNVMKAVYSIKAYGDKSQAEVWLFLDGKVLEIQGAGVIVLGCTEIHLAFNPERSSVPVVRATQVLAGRAIACYQRLSRTERKSGVRSSPDGDGLASDLIAEGMKKCAEKKPVIVTQGSLCPCCRRGMISNSYVGGTDRPPAD